MLNIIIVSVTYAALIGGPASFTSLMHALVLLHRARHEHSAERMIALCHRAQSKILVCGSGLLVANLAALMLVAIRDITGSAIFINGFIAAGIIAFTALMLVLIFITVYIMQMIRVNKRQNGDRHDPSNAQ